MRNIVFDIETKKTVDEVNGWINKHKMGIAVLCAIDYDTGEQMIFSDEYAGALSLNDMHEVMKGNNLIGFNIKNFDMKLLFEEFNKLGQDIYEEFGVFDISDGKKVSLGSLSVATFGDGKLMNGADAPLEWRKNNESRKAVVEYCMDDVIKTKNLLEYGIKNGVVYYMDAKGEKKEWIVDWKKKMLDIRPKICKPKCFGKFRVEKKVWQCSRCAFKVKCRMQSIYDES